MKKIIAAIVCFWAFGANAQSVQQSGVITPGHAACWAITGVIFDCGSPGGGVSVVGSTTTNDFVAFNASGSLIDSGINPANTSAISGLWNFNGGATAPTRTTGDNSTNVATTAFVNASLTAAFTTGTTTPSTDGDVLLVTNNSGKTANSIYSPFSSMGGTEYDSVRGVLDLESVSGTVSQANAIGAYAFCNFNANAASYPAKGNCAAFSGFAVAAKGGALAWSAALDCQDNSTAATYNTGGSRACQNEADIGIWDSTGTATGNGWLIDLQGQGTSAGTLVGVNLTNHATTLKWTFGLNCGNQTVLIACVNLGVQSTGANSASQLLAFEYEKSSTQFAMEVSAAATGGLIFATTDTSITNAMDWSGVTIGTCTLKIAAGCVVSGSGAIEAFETLGVNAFAANTALTAQGSDAGSSNFAAKFQNSVAALIASFRDDGAVFLFGPITMTNATASTSPATGSIVNPGGMGIAGDTFLGGKLSVGGQIISTFGATSIASGACGATTNGTVAGTNASGLITIGAAATTTCTVSFSTTITAPGACVLTAANAKAGGTVPVARISSVGTTNFVITGTDLASTIYYYICL